MSSEQEANTHKMQLALALESGKVKLSCIHLSPEMMRIIHRVIDVTIYTIYAMLVAFIPPLSSHSLSRSLSPSSTRPISSTSERFAPETGYE